jgi:hypothetical protein
LQVHIFLPQSRKRPPPNLNAAKTPHSTRPDCHPLTYSDAAYSPNQISHRLLTVTFPDVSSTVSGLSFHQELRDEVYRYYVQEPDGYHHDAESGKLQTADRKPLDLGLLYTCKKIAAEMARTPFPFDNDIIFRSSLDLPNERDERTRSERYFDIINRHLHALI